MESFFNILWRIKSRIILYFHKYWWITYSTTLFLIFIFLRWLFIPEPIDLISYIFIIISQIDNIRLGEATLAIGGLIAFAVAIRQHKDSKIEAEAHYSPFVFRSCRSNSFEWKKAFYGINNNDDANRLISIKVKGSISNLNGYILHEGYFYPIYFTEHTTVIDAITNKKGLEVATKRTWADNHELIVIPNPSEKKKCKYDGTYFCCTFDSLAGRKYFLEEDIHYNMKLSPFDEKLPKWKRDFLFWIKNR